MDLDDVLLGAAKEGNLPVLQTALEKGADINVKSNDGFTALMFATENKHIDMINLLKAHGAI
ncbi:MAG: ankyrin repeat domain-containing protein [Deltaproteobacteria bacterium]|nr:ankyrin repeat domain-containing protein [Deltaproteobacteria bacterium]